MNRRELIKQLKEILGQGNLKFEQKPEGLEVTLLENRPELNYAYSFKIS